MTPTPKAVTRIHFASGGAVDVVETVVAILATIAWTGLIPPPNPLVVTQTSGLQVWCNVRLVERIEVIA